jgi:hypothetical protein
MRIAQQLLMSLQDVLRGLPGVYALKLTPHLRALFRAAEQGAALPASALMLAPEDLLAMFVTDEGSSHLCVTPFGVRKLIELYREEVLPLRPGVMELQPSSRLLDYIDSEKDLVAQTLQRHLQSERAARLLHNPASITEQDLSYDLLHAIFERHAAPNTSVLSVGNLQVTRYVSRVAKSGREAAGGSVTFRWTGSDGRSRELSR